jgi:hypothetical protein
MVVTPENVHSRHALKSEFKDADNINFDFLFNWAGQLESVERSTSLKSSKYKDLLTKGNFCDSIHDQFFILVNGNVALCCFDYEGVELLGSLKNNSIEQIWRNKEFEKRRYLLKKECFRNYFYVAIVMSWITT